MGKEALIVDDVKMNRVILRSFLTFKGFTVDEAEDGLAAFKRIKQKNYAIVFMDIDMPNMNGLELLARLQKDPKLKDTPVVMLTTHDSATMKEKTMQLGARYHMVKPFDEKRIGEAMRAVGLL